MIRKTLYDKYDKKLIPSLPQVLFEGKIVVVLSEREADEAVDFLLRQPLLGFDTETRPMFKKGVFHNVALLQVSTNDVCFLFRLNLIGIPKSVVRFLEDTRVPKIGLSVHDDMLSLKRRRKFVPGNFIDIQSMVGELGIKDLSLQKLYANIFGQRIAKREQLTNWERDVLTDRQKLYAATDAWACIQLYKELCELRETGNFDLIITDETAEIKQITEQHDI